MSRSLVGCLFASGLVLGAAGCAASAEEGSETGATSSALRGPDTFVAPSTNGVVRIEGTTARGVLQGALVAPNMVLTPQAGLTSSTLNQSLTVFTRPNSRGDRESARVIDRILMPRHGLVLLQLAAPLAERPVVLDTRPLTGPLSVRCSQLNADGGFTGATFTANPIPNNTMLILNGAPPGVVLDTATGGDFGLVCGNAGQAKGLLVYANAPVAGQPAVGLLAHIGDLQSFIGAQNEVLDVRNDRLATPFSLYVTENGVRKCLQMDATGTAMRTAPCDSGLKAQELYFDRRGEAANGAPALLSASRGACVSGALGTEVGAVTQRCDRSRLQSFAMRLTRAGHVHYVQGASNRCLASTPNGTVVLSSDCGETASRNWSISWLPR